ncbi:MAG: hypothetical protein QXL51_01325 [Candidatus Aenigmatarchaeota archaeon]
MINETLISLIILNASLQNFSRCILFSNYAIKLLQENNFTAFGICGYTLIGNTWRYHMWVGILDENVLYEYDASFNKFVRKTEFWSEKRKEWNLFQKDYRYPRVCNFWWLRK